MYDDPSAAVAYDVIHAGRGKGYAAEALAVAELVRARVPDAKSVLDVGCGTGLHLGALRSLAFEVTGVEPAEPMAAAAEGRNPGVTVHRADMRALVDVGRFDAVVCLFSAIGYMTTELDLHAAVRSMGAAVEESGVLIIERWIQPQDWIDGSLFADHGVADGVAVGRVSRSWREGDVSVLEMRYACTTPDHSWSFVEEHRMGLFRAEQYERAIEAAGLGVIETAPGGTGRGLLVAMR